VALIIGEVPVRIFVGAPLPEKLPLLSVRANPLRGWEMIPNSEHYTCEHRVVVNSLGLRGPELTGKRRDERRVLALGDSLIFGQGVGESETVPAQLEQCLRADGCRWRVVNGGLRGYSTNQELALLQELGPRIEPDLVVLFWYWNDIEENNVQQIYRNYQGKASVPFDWRYPLDGMGQVRWHGYQLARSSALLMLVYDQWQVWRAKSPRTEDVNIYIDKLSLYINEFERVCHALQCRFEFAIIPDASALSGEHASDPIVSLVEDLAESKGLRVIDLKAPLRALYVKRGRLPILPFDGHYDGVANATIARGVAAELRKSPIVTDDGGSDFGNRPGMRGPTGYATGTHDNDTD
jgi:hypothetical protein